VIPAPALEAGERAIVRVLRRRYPDASFVVRDGAIGPLDDHMLLEAARRATGDNYAAEEAGENLSTLGGLEAFPEVDEGASNGKLGKAR
jgi:molybdopterin-biosynthesis enzyme MoeA-like protein